MILAWKLRNDFCENAGEEFIISTIIIGIILSVILIAISTPTIYKLVLHHKNTPFPLFIHINQILFYLITILFGISEIISSLISCYISFDKSLYVVGVVLIFRVFHIMTYEIVLLSRLVHVFQNTIYEYIY